MLLYKPVVCEGLNLLSLHCALYMQDPNTNTHQPVHGLIGFESQIYNPLNMFNQGNTHQSSFTFSFYSLCLTYCVSLQRLPVMFLQSQ